MALADVAMYAVVMSKLGAAKMALTTNLNINSLERPANGALRAHGRALKIGKRFAVIDVTIRSDSDHSLIKFELRGLFK